MESRGGENGPEQIAADGPAPEVCFFWPGAGVNSGGAEGASGGVCDFTQRHGEDLSHRHAHIDAR